MATHRACDRICWSAYYSLGRYEQMTPQPGIILSHNYRDKPFVRTLAQDLTAMGVKVWVDEAELRVGDSLITRISLAIDEMRYLGVVLSPHSVDSRWVREELNQALTNQLALRATSVLPILLADCQIPGFLRDRLYADFRDPGNYADALQRLLQSIGIDNPGQRASVIDPFAGRFARISNFYVRPKAWHCIACGSRSSGENNDYLCMECGALRPFAGGSATLVICPECGKGSLGVARYCEWCGTHIHRSVGESVIYRCHYEAATIVGCLCGTGDSIKALGSVLRLDVDGLELTSDVGVDCTVEQIYVTIGQTVFQGSALYRVLRH
jgi:TIR domain